MNFALNPDGPLDVSATLARYRLWGEDPSTRVNSDVLRRVVRLGDRLHPYEVRWQGPVDAVRLDIRVPGTRSPLVAAAVEGEVRRIFGLEFDLPGFYRMAKSDPALAPLLTPLYGLRPTLAVSALEMLVHAITAQQVNLTFAFTLRARLVRRYGTAVTMGGESVYAFPEARTLARVPVRQFRMMQYSVRKAEYIRGVARALASGELDADALAAAPDAHVIERLTALRGLGRWTADWYLARCLGRGPVCPAGDLAVRKVFDRCYGRGRSLSEAAIRRRASAWGPYQNLAVHYLLAGMRLNVTNAGGGT